jgi:tripartite-type tricarboxylate transporter receptor subunit TctC
MIMATRERWPMAIIGGYKSGGEAALGLIRGDFEFCGLPLSVATPFIRSGQIRPIMMIDQKRYPKFPNTPTAEEEGYPDLGIFGTSYWLMASPGVSKARIQILEDALTKTLKDPEFLKWAEGADVDVAFLNGEETKQMVFKIFTLLEQYKKEMVKYIEK